MIDPSRRLWKWGPIDGQVFYVDLCIDQFVRCKEVLGFSWSDAMIFVHKGKVFFASDYEDLFDCGEEMFREFFLNEEKKNSVYGRWSRVKDEIVQFVDRTTEESLRAMSDAELLDSRKSFSALIEDFWTYGMIPEIANFGGERLLRQAIEEAYPGQVVELMEVLSAPEELSFFQIEELELLELALENKPLDAHQQKYSWIRNGYGEVLVAEKEWFEERAKGFSREQATEQIDKIKSFSDAVKEKKRVAAAEFGLSNEILMLANLLSFGIWWQDYRKKFVFIGLRAHMLFAKEIGRRRQIPFTDLLLYGEDDMRRLFETGEGVANIQERAEGHVHYYRADENTGFHLYGLEAQELAKKYAEVEFDVAAKEIAGTVVSKGKARGRVRLLAGARHFDLFREGEVLVTSMTSPEFIVAMRKAAAIVTDEGGITCHAAIVSRELGTPCVVGTGVATRVLRDGDLVEVDADNGVVRKL